MPRPIRSLRVPMTLVVVFVAFFLLGFPDGVFGTAWPDIHREMSRSVGDLSWLVALWTVGHMIATGASGHLTGRWKASRVLVAAIITSALGAIGFGLAPTFILLNLAVVLIGVGGGLIDAVANAWLALRHGARAMGFLHAFFGIGATLGPIAIAGVLARGWSWRSVFFALAVGQVILLAMAWGQRAEFDRPDLSDDVRSETSEHPASSRLLVLSLAWFFIIVGLEVAVGSWSFSLLVESRGVDTGPAAFWTAGFWGAMTVGRLGLGFIGHRLPGLFALRGALGVTAVGVAILWANPTFIPAGVAFPIIGLGISLLFPLMVLITPQWLGPERTERAVGYQFAAAGLGAVAFSAIIGPLANTFGLEVLDPVLAAGTLVAIVLLVLMQRTVHDQVVPTRSVAAAIAGVDPHLERRLEKRIRKSK